MELTNYHALKSPRPFTLPELIEQLDTIEALDNPDVVLDLSGLRMSPTQNIIVPQLGEFALTDWSQRQLANLTGIKFDRWFENARPEERADEMNRRFARATIQIKVRTTRALADGVLGDGTLRAFVSPSYQPISDSFVASLVLSALQRSENEFPIIRSNITPRSVTYSVRVGQAYQVGGPGEVGDIWGGIIIRNSGVGFSSLSIALHLTRLICKNGMTVPIGGSQLLRRRHQGQIEENLWERVSHNLIGIGEKLSCGIKTLTDARNITVDDPRRVIETVLQRAHLPKKMVEPLMVAFSREPHASAFGISQALTDAQTHQEMGLSPEDRLALEDAAGSYVQSVSQPV